MSALSVYLQKSFQKWHNFIKQFYPKNESVSFVVIFSNYNILLVNTYCEKGKGLIGNAKNEFIFDLMNLETYLNF